MTISSFSEFEELLRNDATLRKKSWLERVSYTPGEMEIECYDAVISEMNKLKFIEARKPHCIIAEIGDEPLDLNKVHFAINNLKLNGRVETIDNTTYISFRGEVTLTTLKALGLEFDGSDKYPDITQTTMDVDDFYGGGINDREKRKDYYGDRNRNNDREGGRR